MIVKPTLILLFSLLCLQSFATKIEGKLTGFANQKLVLLQMQGIGFKTDVKECLVETNGNFSFELTVPSDEIVLIADENQRFYIRLMVSPETPKIVVDGFINEKGQFGYQIKEGELAQFYISATETKSLLLRQREALWKLGTVFPQNSTQGQWAYNEWQNNSRQLDSLMARIKTSKSDLLSYYFSLEDIVMAQNNPQGTVALANAFLKIEFSDSRLFKTGLLRPLIDQQIKLLDALLTTQGKAVTDSMYHKTIDHIVSGLSRGDEKQTPSVLNYLMNGFTNDKKTEYITYLSEKSLKTVSCSFENDKDLEVKLKQNALLKVGTKMADMDLSEQNKKIKKLSDINAKHIITLYWSSECAHCQDELPKLKRLYPLLKEQGVELVTISMDTKWESYEAASKDFPWISLCDLKSVGSPLVKDYYITGTPTLFMMDKNLVLEYKNQVNVADALAAVFGIQTY